MAGESAPVQALPRGWGTLQGHYRHLWGVFTLSQTCSNSQPLPSLIFIRNVHRVMALVRVGMSHPSVFRLNEKSSEVKTLLLSSPRSCSHHILPGKRNNKPPLFQNMAHFPHSLMKNAFLLLLLSFICRGVYRSKGLMSVKKLTEQKRTVRW